MIYMTTMFEALFQRELCLDCLKYANTT